MAKNKKRKSHHVTYEEPPLCDCGAMHSTGGIDDWGCAACGDKPQDQDEGYDDE